MKTDQTEELSAHGAIPDVGSDSSESESIHPFQQEGQHGTRVRRSSVSTSIFESHNSTEFPVIESSQNPLVSVINTHLERESEARNNDERAASEVLSFRERWKQRLQFFWQLIRPDFLLLHHDIASLKVVSRSWLQLFISTIFFVIPSIDHFVGTASFLLILLGVIEAAGDNSYSQAFYTGIIDLVFVLTAFTFTTIGNAVGWSIRGYPSLTQLMQELSDQGICPPNNFPCFQHEVHTGRYLNTKATVFMFIMMICSMTLLGFMQVRNKLFALSWILSAIATVITGIYLAMTPNFTPWLYGGAVVRPIGISLATRWVVSLFWFPVSSNFKFFSVVIKSLNATKSILSADIGAIKAMSPADPEFSDKVDGLFGKINKSLSIFALLKSEGLFARGEFAYSRFDPGNLGEFRSNSRQLLNSLAGIRYFFTQISEKHDVILGLSLEQGSQRTQSFDNEDVYKRNNNASTGQSDSEVQTSAAADEMKKDMYSSSTSPESQEKSAQPGKYPEADGAGVRQKSGAALRHIMSPLRKETFSENDPKILHGSKWFRKRLGKRLSKSYAHAGNFEEQRFILSETMYSDNMRMEDLETLYRSIVSHYEPLSKANMQLIDEVIAWAVSANKFRFWSIFNPSAKKKHIADRELHNEKVSEALTALEEMMRKEDETKFMQWVHSYCTPGTLRSRQHYIYALCMDAFYCQILENMASHSIKAAKYCLLMDAHRPNATLIYPFMKSLSLSPRFESEYHAHGHDGGDDIAMTFEPMPKVQSRNPDASPPRTLVHLIGRQVEKLWHILTDPRLVFCVKRGMLGVVASMTFVCRSTIYFSYKEHLVWVPIITVLTVSMKAVDGVYGFIVKLNATFVGALCGMILWYIGDGHGHGNSYGYVAASMLIMLPLLWYRHFHTLAIPMGAVILCVTAVLVSGSSWLSAQGLMLDTKIGYGFSVAWRRFASVIVGLGIAFVGTILPHPVTAKKQLRGDLGYCLENIGEVQAGISNFMFQRLEDPRVHVTPRRDMLTEKLRGIKMTIASTQQLMRLIKYEPPLGGFWPRYRMELLVKLVHELVFLVDTIYHLIDSLEDTSTIPIIWQRLGWSSIDLVSGTYSVITMTSKALSTGDPLPSVSPGHLSEIYSQQVRSFLNFDAERGKKGLEGLLEDRYVKHDGRITLALITTVSAFYKRLDSCVHLVKGLVGEKYATNLALLVAGSEEEPLIWPEYVTEKEEADAGDTHEYTA